MTDQPSLGCAKLFSQTMAILSETIDARAAAGDTTHSYTAKLLDAGPIKCAKKLIEEAGELGLAVSAQDEDEVTAEAADLIYHALVALRSRGVSLERVAAALAERQNLSGLEEFASRTAGN